MKQTGVKFIPSDEQRSIVSMLSAVLTPLEDIAKVIINPATKKHVALDTLKKSFKDEISDGRIKVRAFAVGKLFKLMEEGHPASVFFYLKTQCGWRETMEHQGPSGGPIPLKTKVQVEFVPAKVS